MSKLDNLIAELCPDGVEWKPLGEICDNVFLGKNKQRCYAGIYQIFGSTGVIGRTNNKVYKENQILIARVGVNAGYVYIGQGESFPK